MKIRKKKACVFVALVILILLVLGIKRHKTNRKKYVIFQCLRNDNCGGWADRLKGMTSAYAWSLLSNRKLLLNVDKYCPLKDIFESNQIDWNQDLDLVLNKLQTKEFSSARISRINEIGFWGVLRKTDPAEYEKDKDVIIIQNNIDWIQPFSENVNLTRRIRDLGFEKEQFQPFYVFRKFYREMFKFTPNLQAKYSDYLKQVGSSTLICLQLRSTYNDWAMTPADMEQILTFTKQVLIPMAGKDYKIFVTSDTTNRQDEALNALKMHNAFKIDGPIFNMDLSKPEADWKKLTLNCTSYEKIFMDFHMFQNCKIALISQSGYGKHGLWIRDNPFENFFAILHKNESGRLNQTQILQMKNSADTYKYFKYS